MLIATETLWLLVALIMIAVILVLSLAMLAVGGPGAWFDSMKGFFAMIATYVISQLALLLRP